MIVQLHSDDITEVNLVASRLSDYWQQDEERTLEGLKAEFAAVKYFNHALGASPEIWFNKCYKNGGDGGFDFRIPQDVKWDVKSVFGDAKPRSEHLKKTKADCILLVRRLEENCFKMIGFNLVKKIPDTEFVGEETFTDANRLIRLFPNSLKGNQGLVSKREHKHPVKIGNVIEKLVYGFKGAA
jgi:hypothetical protein